MSTTILTKPATDCGVVTTDPCIQIDVATQFLLKGDSTAGIILNGIQVAQLTPSKPIYEAFVLGEYCVSLVGGCKKSSVVTDPIVEAAETGGPCSASELTELIIPADGYTAERQIKRLRCYTCGADLIDCYFEDGAVVELTPEEIEQLAAPSSIDIVSWEAVRKITSLDFYEPCVEVIITRKADGILTIIRQDTGDEVDPSTVSAAEDCCGEDVIPFEPFADFYAFGANRHGNFVADVIDGIGTAEELNTSTRYLPDASDIYQPFTSGQVGERYYKGEWWVHAQAPTTNSQTYSYDLTNSEWTKTGITATKDIVGLRGDANGATRLTATVDGGTVIGNIITAASGAQVARFFLKRRLGTGTVEITLDGGATWTDITTELDASTIWLETLITDPALANPQIGIRMGTSGDQIDVGNAEAHLGLYYGMGEVRGGSPIFTDGVPVFIDESDMSFDITNRDDAQGYWYWRMVPFANDDEWMLQDLYPIAPGDGPEGAAANFANGSLVQAQYLPGAGATSQIQRPFVAGREYQVAFIFDATSGDAQQSLDGVVDGGSTTYSGFDTGTKIKVWYHLLVGSVKFNGLIKDVTRNNETFVEAQATITALMAGSSDWGGSNLLPISRDYSDWSWVKGASTSATYDQAGLFGEPNTASLLTESTTTARFIREELTRIPHAGKLTARHFIKKDNDETRFPEFLLQTTGTATQTAYAQINTKTGAAVQRTGSNFLEVRDAGDWWELLMGMDEAGVNDTVYVTVYPAYASTLGGVDGTAVGSIIIGNSELYDGLAIADIPAGIANAVIKPEGTL